MGQYHACGRGKDIKKCHLCLLQPSLCTINTQWHFIVFLSCHKRILLLKVRTLQNTQYEEKSWDVDPAGRWGHFFWTLYCNMAQTQCRRTWSDMCLPGVSHSPIRSPSVTHLETSCQKRLRTVQRLTEQIIFVSSAPITKCSGARAWLP